MMSFQQLRKIFIAMSFTVAITITLAFSFGTPESWAAISDLQSGNQPQVQIASSDRVGAVTKDLEGKAQEAIGNITGDVKNQALGKAKQVEGQARNAAQDLKDNLKLDKQVQAVKKEVKGKVNEMRSR